jgi:SlyX protein
MLAAAKSSPRYRRGVGPGGSPWENEVIRGDVPWPPAGARVRAQAMTDDNRERLELKIAFLERASNELSDAVYAQQRQIDALRAELLALTGRVTAAAAQGDYPLEAEKPPHY